MTSLDCIQFTDGTARYPCSKNLNHLRNCVEIDLLSLQDWFYANKLTLNVGKSVGILFKPNKNKVKFKISLDGMTIPMVTDTKFLGIWLDEKRLSYR